MILSISAILGNRYPAIYIILYAGTSLTVNKRVFSWPDKIVSFVINLLNNKTIILLNLAEYSLILANSAYGLVGSVSGNILRDFAG